MKFKFPKLNVAAFTGLALILGSLQTYAQDNQNEFKFIQESGGIKEYTLTKNDLQVLLMEDHSAPVLTFMVTYKVGSRNEVIGNTGSTHLLEHLMFKGTPTFNKANGTQISSALQNIGAIMNASTWLDRTNYYEMIPSEYLELAVQIESDRMRNLLLDEKDRASEMTVVRNEFEIGENDPEEALDKNIWATAYQAHPYHHSTIGWRSDIENVPIGKLREFYETFYWPNNAVVTVIGDFNTKNALNLVYKYFGNIPKSPQPIPTVYTEEPKQEGPRRVIVKRSGQNGIVGVGHKNCKALDKDYYSFDILDRVLSSGKNSRLYKALVEKAIATNVSVALVPFQDEGLIITYATLTPSSKHEDVERIILEEYQKIQDEGITDVELNAAKAQIRSGEAFKRDGSFSIASQINTAIAVGSWKFFTTYLDGIDKVTAADIQNVAKKYLVEDQMTVGYFIPKKDEDTQKMGYLKDHNSNHPRSYRDAHFLFNEQISNDNNVLNTLETGSTEKTNLAKNILDQKVSGVRVVTMKTGVKDVVTIRGSLMGGNYFSPATNKAVADMTVAMLDQGTTKRDKFAIAAALEKLGATLTFSTGNETVNFSARCLRSDAGTVINILAEELRYPLFDEKSFENVKKRRMARYKENLENTDVRAAETLAQKIYPPDHPNYSAPTEQLIKDIEKTTLADVKDYYEKIYGPASMIIVAVGDVDSKEIQNQVKTNFAGWTGGIQFNASKKAEPKIADKQPTVVPIKDKTSVTLYIGTGIGLKQDDNDYLPLNVGNYILGGNFSARLMSNVRDNEGLTYGIYSTITGQTYSDGAWLVGAYFSPDLCKRGLESTQKQVAMWLDKGVSEAELKAKKTTITGVYKVALSTTGGVAAQLLSLAQRNIKMDYLDEYPAKINALTLDEVNGAIKKYIKPDSLHIIVAGSVDANLEKMKP
ncbi:insulinase family protein [bacterium]|nr:insulinase family protein [bacterium]